MENGRREKESGGLVEERWTEVNIEAHFIIIILVYP
jgi:hypothetical protein